MIDQNLIEDIKHAEGCPTDPISKLPIAYKDGLGNWTGGWGHLLDQTIDWTGYTWNWSTVFGWLAADLQKRATQAASTPEWPFLDTPCRRNAVIECIFNLGEGHWISEFPGTRAAIQQQNWQLAHDKLMASPLWIKQVGLARVARLANYLLTGSYP